MEWRLSCLSRLNLNTFHIGLYTLASLAILFAGLTLVLLLAFAKGTNRVARLFLNMALVVIVLKAGGLTSLFLPTLGPLLYFYVRQLTCPDRRFHWKDTLHFSLLLTGYWMPGWLVLVSVIIYLYLAHRLIEGFYRRLKTVLMDRPRFAFRRLDRALLLLGLFCVLSLFSEIFYLVIALVLIGLTMEAILKPDINVVLAMPVTDRSDAREKGRRLKEAVAVNRLYEDAELTLTTLAVKLMIHPHDLSRIINVGLEKNFSDFINEFRVREIARKMNDPAYGRLTLLGIAYECGFNSKTTFNRVFKEITGKTPVEYKNSLDKKVPINKLALRPSIRPVILRSESPPNWAPVKLKRNIMIRNYLKIAWRNLSRNKASSLINIGGLAVGLACSLLILLWVQNEYSMDAWHPNGARIYAIYERDYIGHKAEAGYGAPALMADEVKKVFPEIEYATQFDWGTQNTFQVGEKIAKMNGHFASADYFKVFGNKLLQGNAQNALNTPASISISRKMAVEFFGSPEAAIGKSIRFDNIKNFVVGAVFEDLPATSSEKFDYIVNWYEFMLENSGWAKDWSSTGPRTFVMLRGDANPVTLDKKLTHFLDAYNKDQKAGVFTVSLGIQPYNDVYLHGSFTEDKLDGGRIEYVRLFSIIAIFILLIACINFMNLSTARSLSRAREIGVRKVVGALRASLIKQFISESMLITVIAVVFSLALLIWLLPVFNQVTLKDISLPFGEPEFWFQLLAITLLTGLLAGSYPALFMSSFSPVKVLKGTLKSGRGVALFRKGLVVFQFFLSTVLIIGTVIISRQINYIQTKNLGYNRENLVYLPLDGDLKKNYEIFKQEALQQPGIQSISRMSQQPTNILNGTSGVIWTGKDPDNRTQFTQASVGYDFVKSMKIKMATGRDYSKNFPSDSVGYLVNETALKVIGYKDPVGKPLTFWGKPGRIIGVIKDFHFNSFHEPVNPLVLRFGENETYGSALIRTQPGKTKEALAALQSIWKQLNPEFAFNYTFSDDEYQKLYQNEQVTGKLSDAFSFLAIFISCLGLLGLAMFTAEQRVKEIGIRKVLGASVGSVFGLLSKEFLGLVVIALAIAVPVAWYAMHKWLENYQFSEPIQWWMFALSGALIVVIALATISIQTMKAALTNPVKSLRSE